MEQVCNSKKTANCDAVLESLSQTVKRVKRVDFVFENCEVLTVLGSSPRILLSNLHFGDGYKNLHPEKVRIIFEGDSYKHNNKILMNRLLQFRDLTYIRIVCDDGDVWYSVLMPWSEYDSEENTYQKVYIGLNRMIVDVIKSDNIASLRTFNNDGTMKRTTIKDLYNWAYDHDALYLPVGIRFQDSGGMYAGDSWSECHDKVACSIEVDEHGDKYVVLT